MTTMSTDKHSDIRLITLASYVKPKPYEVMSKDWVLNGKKNEFYQRLIDANNDSPTNSSINKSFADLIYGRGLGSRNSDTNINDWVKVTSTLRPEDIRRIVMDFQVFNEATFQVIRERGGSISEIKHIPNHFVVPNKVNDDMEIETYWFSKNWKQPTGENEPQGFPAFGMGNDAVSIYRIKPYSPGSMYFADPNYIAGLPYCDMEREIANLNLNSIKNGLSAGYIINIPDGKSYSEDEKDALERQIKAKLTGSPNASRFILSFNGRDVEITITPFPVNEQIHKQWEFLTEEAKQQILTAHRATSPSLAGIISSSGFSNTADEMDTAEQQLVKRVIKPKQDEITDAFEEVFRAFGISQDLYFKPLTEAQVETEVQEQADVQELSSDADMELYAQLYSYSEAMPDGYREIKEDDLTMEELNEVVNLAATANSEQDSPLWKIRYSYQVGTRKIARNPSRAFCRQMERLARQGRVYRKEDIDNMSAAGVNGQFAHSGGSYDIFLYAGGVNCHHRWERRIFKKRRDEDGKPLGGNAMQNVDPVNVNEARRQGAKIPRNPADVAIAEIDKPNNGRYPG